MTDLGPACSGNRAGREGELDADGGCPRKTVAGRAALRQRWIGKLTRLTPSAGRHNQTWIGESRPASLGGLTRIGYMIPAIWH